MDKNTREQIRHIEMIAEGVNVIRADEGGFDWLQKFANELANMAFLDPPPDVFVADFHINSEMAGQCSVFFASEQIPNNGILFDRARIRDFSREELYEDLGHEIGHLIQTRLHVFDFPSHLERLFQAGIRYSALATLSSAVTFFDNAYGADLKRVVTDPGALFGRMNDLGFAETAFLATAFVGTLAAGTALASGWAYSRGVIWHQEYEADRIGVKLTGNYAAAISSLRRPSNDGINEEEVVTGRRGSVLSFFRDARERYLRTVEGIFHSTHPPTEKRIAYLEKLRDERAAGKDGADNPRTI